MQIDEFHIVSYKTRKNAKSFHRGYVKAIWTETLLIPVIKEYRLFSDDKKTLIKIMTPLEAEKELAEGKIKKG